jgi:hypothetical protein
VGSGQWAVFTVSCLLLTAYGEEAVEFFKNLEEVKCVDSQGSMHGL